MHQGEITWHTMLQTKSETGEMFFFFIYLFEGINHSLSRAAEPVYKERKKASMESSWSVGMNMTY